MQFTLKTVLFSFVPVAAISLVAGILLRHWDLRSYYLGFYGRTTALPSWATGTGRDWVSESLGGVAWAIWTTGPWLPVVIFLVAAAVYGAQVKGGAR